MKKRIVKILIATILFSVYLFSIFTPQKAFLTEVFAASAEESATAEDTNANTEKREYAVIFVKFSDTDEFSEEFLQTIKRTYNDSKQSVKKYFSKVSRGKYEVNFNFISQVAVSLNEKQKYYEPKYYYSSSNDAYEVVNEDGYDNRYFLDDKPCKPQKIGAKRHIDRLLREQSLIRDVISSLKTIDESFVLDGDGDGIVDGVNFIFQTSDGALDAASWDDVLWQHKSSLIIYNEKSFEKEYYIPDDTIIEVKDFLPKSINGKAVKNYQIFPASELKSRDKLLIDNDGLGIYSPTILCHELMHDLGLGDYYSYEEEGEYKSVGDLDIMGSSGVLPSAPLVYTACRLGFISDDEVSPIENSGRYTIFPSNGDNAIKGYKLVLNDYEKTGEYFMIEARSNEGDFIDASLKNSGVIIYRINEKNGYINSDGEVGNKNYANAYGDNEVYVFRIGGGKIYDGRNDYSYAVLNGKDKNHYHYEEKSKFDGSTIGTTDKSVCKPVIDENSGFLVTPITYGNGENSGIKLSNITENADGSYSFDIEFDDQKKQLNYGGVSTYYDGRRTVKWNGGLREGTVSIYAYPAESLVKYKDGDYVLKKKFSPDAIESGSLNGVALTYQGRFIASYAWAFIPEFTDFTALFLTYEEDSEKTAVFVGVLNAPALSFKEYFFGTTKWVVAVIVLGVICGALIIGAIVFFAVKEFKNKKEEAEPLEDTIEALSEKFGENYWMGEGNSENEEDAEIADKSSTDDAEVTIKPPFKKTKE